MYRSKVVATAAGLVTGYLAMSINALVRSYLE